MTNPRPSASTFAIDGGASESVERVPLYTDAMDPRDDDRRGSLPSLTSLLFRSRALEGHVYRYSRVTNGECVAVATRRDATRRDLPPRSPLYREYTNQPFFTFPRSASSPVIGGRQCRGTMARVTKRARGAEHRACEDARTPNSDATRRDERFAARERDNAGTREFHQVARPRRSRSPEEHVTRREGVHRSTACLAMLRGAMTALASPPSSPPKQPPLSPHPPTLVPSDIPCYSHAPRICPLHPLVPAGSTATTLPSLPLAQF